MTINLSSRAVDGISKALNQDFYRVETPERMAWVSILLKKLDDTEDWFPHGKWGTIQNIDKQIDMCAAEAILILTNNHNSL